MQRQALMRSQHWTGVLADSPRDAFRSSPRLHDVVLMLMLMLMHLD
jgi:hypothetical protein